MSGVRSWQKCVRQRSTKGSRRQSDKDGWRKRVKVEQMEKEGEKSEGGGEEGDEWASEACEHVVKEKKAGGRWGGRLEALWVTLWFREENKREEEGTWRKLRIKVAWVRANKWGSEWCRERMKGRRRKRERAISLSESVIKWDTEWPCNQVLPDLWYIVHEGHFIMSEDQIEMYLLLSTWPIRAKGLFYFSLLE